MSGGFEEWSTARTPSLLAFASALVEDERHADAAVTRTLVRINRTWERLRRDDPDVVARRLVVRACSTPRRGAAVLRALEDRSDAEIADILGCSESAARRHVHRGLAGAHQNRAADAASVRDELVARAGSAPTQLLTRPPEMHQPDEPPRRRRGATLAALAVIALIGGVAYVSHESRTPKGVITYPRVDVPQTWRYESYAGVQLQVPDAWGWGGSPVTSAFFTGARHLGACGSNEAAVLSPADGATYVSVLTGFVGRPAILNQRCVPWGSEGSYPPGDAVWFDSPLAVGVKPVGSTTAETRDVGGQHVTAFSQHSNLRRQILGTAERVDVDGNGCSTRPVTAPRTGPRDLEPSSLSICIYSQDTGVATLMWSGRLPEAEARAYAAAVDGTANEAGGVCPTPSGRWAALGLQGDAGARWDIVNLGCRRLQLAGGDSAPLTPDTVEPWAVGGATAYLSAPRGAPDLDGYFTAPSG
jgi:hypothetical protein